MHEQAESHDATGSTALLSVAATVAVLTLGASALWTRSSGLSTSSILSALRSQPTEPHGTPETDSATSAIASQAQQQAQLPTDNKEKSRSKDRRRRNKDPIGDVILRGGGGKKKGGKKAHALATALLNNSATPAAAAVMKDSTDDDGDEAGPSELNLPSISSSLVSLPDSTFSSASSSAPSVSVSVSRPPLPNHPASSSSTKSAKTIKPEPRPTPSFESPWDESSLLKEELEKSKKRAEQEEKKARNARGTAIIPGSRAVEEPELSSNPSLSNNHNHAAPTKRPETPSSLNHTDISTQTQLASLRGALEAARLREEKAKTDLEKAMKDIESLRWENTNGRRREMEMQAQMSHLVAQLQSYASMFASMSYHGQRPPMTTSQSTSALSSPPLSPFSPIQGQPMNMANALYAASHSSDSELSSNGSPSPPFPPSLERGRRMHEMPASSFHAFAPSLSLPLSMTMNLPPRSETSASASSSASDDGSEDILILNDSSLAESILKNPGSMGFASSPSKAKKEEHEPAIKEVDGEEEEEGEDVEEVKEFEFPTLNSGFYRPGASRMNSRIVEEEEEETQELQKGEQ